MVHGNAAADVKADLYATIPGDGSIVTLTGNLTRGDITPVDYLYDENSTAPDNYPDVVCPTLQTGNGRWIRTLFNQYQGDWAQANSAAPDYIKNKPATAKRQETYSGTTNASGNYTVTFGTAYAAAPNIQANITGGTALQRSTITSITTTGFTVNVVSQNTNTLLGIVSLVSSTTLVNGASVDVLITEK